MPGKTISAYTDAETVKRIEAIAVQEQRKKAQVAGMALQFFAALPDEARAAWLQMTAGNPAEREAIAQEITRVLLQAQSDLAHRRILAEMQTQALGALDTEDEILEVAVSLTRR
ncbi:MAG: hypothetical protein VKJ46_01480 [Leptolyngbyaceae bacterium]|nr:hypothetical protein [Leptolyngbyaceae bacterium]